MKRISFLPLLVALVIFLGCEETNTTQPKKNQLTIEQGRICLKGESKDCGEGKGKLFRLGMYKGKPQLTAFRQPLANQPTNWMGFKRGKAMKAGSYQLEQKGRSLLMAGKGGEWKVPAGTGLYLYLDRKGQAYAYEPNKAKLPVHEIRTRKGTIYHDKVPYGKTLLLSSMPLPAKSQEGVRMMLAQGDLASRIIPNDTGTEIVIDDVLIATSCCETVNGLHCCDDVPAGEVGVNFPSVSTVIEASQISGLAGMAEAYPNESIAKSIISGSYKTVMVLTAESSCIYRSGNTLMIIDCVSGKRYCLNGDDCLILLQSNAEGEIAVMVKKECTAFDEVSACG